jgi:hypothetical protein
MKLFEKLLRWRKMALMEDKGERDMGTKLKRFNEVE